MTNCCTELNRKVIITAPSLDPTQNVSGVSSVAQFIIGNNKKCDYLHFQIGKTDSESGGVWSRVKRIWHTYSDWKKLLADNKDATIHYSFPLSAPSILRDPWFMWYALRQGRKMVVHVHGGLFLTSPKIPLLLEKILKWVFSWDVTFIVLSVGEKETLQKRYGARRVEVLANCPDAPKGNETQSEIAAPACWLSQSEATERTIREHGSLRYGASAYDNLVLGYIGRIEPNKGMTELLEAMTRCREEGMQVKVRFAGKEEREGEFIPKYQEALGGSFEYCGLVSGQKKEEFIKSLDAFVMPTYFEGLPMSLLETMAYGVVPVVTNVGSIGTVVKDGENGIFVKVRDVDSIVEAIRRLDTDRELLASLRENARKTIKENFSAAKYVEKLNSIYEGL